MIKAAEAGRQARADAEALVLARQEAFNEADEVKEETEDALLSGNERITALELATNRAEVDRTDLLLTAAKRAVSAAERKIVNDDKRVADVVAPLVQKAIGIGVTSLSLVPNRTDLDIPELVVIQPEPAEMDRSTGTLSAKLQVWFNRPPLYATLDARAIQDAINAAGFSAGVNVHQVYTSIHGDIAQDVLTFQVHHAWDSAPVIPELTDKGAKSVGLGCYDAIRAVVPEQPLSAPPRYTGQPGVQRNATSALQDHTIVSSAVDGNGMLRSVVRATIYAWKVDRETAEKAVGEISNLPSPGAGVIESALVTDFKSANTHVSQMSYDPTKPVLITVEAKVISKTI